MDTTVVEQTGTGYSGADWVEHSAKLPMSETGRRVANLLGWVFRGIYHQQRSVAKAKWDGDYVTLCIYGGLSTFDSDVLTRLVVAAHDMALRVEIEGAAPNYLRLTIHPRQRTGSTPHRHATIEDAVERIRKDRQGGERDGGDE